MEVYFLEALPRLPTDLVAFSEDRPKAAKSFHCNSQRRCSTSTCTCCQQGSEPGKRVLEPLWEGWESEGRRGRRRERARVIIRDDKLDSMDPMTLL